MSTAHIMESPLSDKTASADLIGYGWMMTCEVNLISDYHHFETFQNFSLRV